MVLKILYFTFTVHLNSDAKLTVILKCSPTKTKKKILNGEIFCTASILKCKFR